VRPETQPATRATVAPRHSGARPANAFYHGRETVTQHERHSASPPVTEDSMNDALHTIAPEQIREHVGEAEWAARVRLAAAYPLLHRYGMTDLIYNHATLRVDRKSTRLNSSHVKISYAV